MDLSGRFAANLKQARSARGITQEALADKCDLHRTEISLLERGEREPRLGTLLKLASALDASAETLVAGIWWLPESGRFEIDRSR